jgi:hypothetical protein
MFYLAQPAYYLFFSALSAISAVNKNKNRIHSLRVCQPQAVCISLCDSNKKFLFSLRSPTGA